MCRNERLISNSYEYVIPEKSSVQNSFVAKKPSANPADIGRGNKLQCLSPIDTWDLFGLS